MRQVVFQHWIASGFLDTPKPHNEAQIRCAMSKLKIEAVEQVTDTGKRVADVAQRLGMSVHSLYAWIKIYSKP